jgi:hypothetical protein
VRHVGFALFTTMCVLMTIAYAMNTAMERHWMWAGIFGAAGIASLLMWMRRL